MRPVRKLKKALNKTDSVRPLLMMQPTEHDEQDDVPLSSSSDSGAGLRSAPSSSPSSSSSSSSSSSPRRLVLTNVAWKSWVPRLATGLLLIVSACVVVGLRPAFWNIALVMAVLGSFFVFKTKAETYVFDADAQQFVWQRRTLFHVKRREFWFHEIQTVKLVELSDGQGGLDSNLYVCMTDGSRLKIFSGQLITLKGACVVLRPCLVISHSFSDRSRVLAKQQIDRFLASCAASDSEVDPQPVALEQPTPERATAAAAAPEPSPATTPGSKKGMQRRITAVLGRNSQRRLDKSPSRKQLSDSFGSNDNNDIV